MKILKSFATLAFVAFLFSANVQAQDRAKQDIGQIDRVAVLVKKLDLNKKQESKIREITTRFQSQKERAGENKEQIAVLRKSYKKQVETVLTPEQKSKFKRMGVDKKDSRKDDSASQLDKMKMRYDLSDEQYARMQVIQNSYVTRIESAKKSGNTDKVQSLREEMLKNFTSILTPEQRMKMEENKKQMKKTKRQKKAQSKKKSQNKK